MKSDLFYNLNFEKSRKKVIFWQFTPDYEFVFQIAG